MRRLDPSEASATRCCGARGTSVGLLWLLLSAGPPLPGVSTARASEPVVIDPHRWEASLGLAHDGLLGQAAFLFDSGFSADGSLAWSLNRPRSNRLFRQASLRATAGYATFDGVDRTRLSGLIMGLDLIVVGKAAGGVRPYGFVGIGRAQLKERKRGFVTDADGLGPRYGIGAKAPIARRLVLGLEVGRHRYPVIGRDPSSPNAMNYIQFLFHVGASF